MDQDFSSFSQTVNFSIRMMRGDKRVVLRVVRLATACQPSELLVLFVTGFHTLISFLREAFWVPTREFPVYFIETREKP